MSGTPLNKDNNIFPASAPKREKKSSKPGAWRTLIGILFILNGAMFLSSLLFDIPKFSIVGYICILATLLLNMLWLYDARE